MARNRGTRVAGASPGLDAHSGAVPCLVVGLDHEFTLVVDRRIVHAQSALVPARLPHHLDARGGRIVSWYMDPASTAPRICREAMRVSRRAVMFKHRAQSELIDLGKTLHSGSDPGGPARWMAIAAGAPVRDHTASRLRALTEAIISDPTRDWRAGTCAKMTGFSESAFLRTFAARTGTSFRRYRLWARTLRAVGVLAAGENLTRAAAEAGFATPSHLSSTFHTLFGLTPSRILRAGLTIIDARFPATASLTSPTAAGEGSSLQLPC